MRPGIALYGGSPFDEDDPRLKPVAALRTPILQVRTIKPGETVGYSASKAFDAPTRLATLMLGYGDGFPRSGSNKGHVVIKGQRAPIVGRVSMDMISLDITKLSDEVHAGDEAEFFGPNHSLFEAAMACGTLPYEMLTSLGGRIQRRYHA